ncbi:head-tail connector protein [Sphingobium cupriresistens]|uniref:Uncharacterized protein n=1 Tax=Sphingobium cupriresistens LL01 TaxID=1420583 RepID=A0A0J7XSR1_9SPHN|nr:head-tail connector protein [Sphingobium cupriresistens]KMS54717.1 hypothetical protein V473_15375 [Sphingobium cupriresistens LL01]
MAEPIALEQAKAQLRVDGDDEDQVIRDAIVSARGWVERYTGLVLTRRAIREALPAFGYRLRAWPVVSITSVSYFDPWRAAHTLDADLYMLDASSRPARLLASSWPRYLLNSRVTVEMQAGFADAAAINEFEPVLMQAMRQLLAGFYHDRETGGLAGAVEDAARDLCRPLKTWTV